MRKVLFIDRDGTLIVEPPDQQIDSLEKLEFIPGVFQWLGKIARETDYELVIVTNQDGLGTAAFPEESFWPAHNKMIQAFANEGIIFSNVLIDKSLPSENKPTRKPGTALLTSYMNAQYNIAESFVIGDRLTDLQLAKNLGCRGILLNTESLSSAANGTSDVQRVAKTWADVYSFLADRKRIISLNRVTKETSIKLTLDLDGSGKSEIKTGIAFFDHMLDQLSKHSGVDLQISVDGDLQVDEHHTIEDTALALGDAFYTTLGDKRGIERYGFCLPMDDCLAQVAIDFGGRPWLVWNASFSREKIGDMPTEMFFHFFKSFSDHARCNLNIQADGNNEHHKIEAIFKALAKSIKVAIRKEGNELPTTKGILE